ncbi:polysaccharide deacetylase family protein [Streptococcus suis]|nr:polysaccharide deacetylase family protein [Streptococcus suis]
MNYSTPTKKIILALLSVILLVSLVLFTTSKIIGHFETKNATSFIEKTESALQAKSDFYHESYYSGTTYISTYIPKDTNGQPLESINEKVQTYLDEKFASKKRKKRVTDIVFVETRSKKSSFQGVSIQSVEAISYHVDGFSISKKESTSLYSQWLTTDNQVFTIGTFLSDLNLAHSIFAGQLNQILTQKGQEQSTVENIVNQFIASDISSYSFSYANSQLTLKVPKSTYGVKEISVPITAFYDILQSSYLSDTDRAAYDAYQEEQKKIASQKRLAITFDDGPNRETTPQVLDYLKKYGVKATFFVLGKNVAGNEDILKRMIDEGHEVANHSWSHPSLTGLTADQVRMEIEETQAAIKEATGVEPTLVRPPYGAVNQSVMTVINKPIIYWSVDSNDWQSRNAGAILSQVQSNTYPGSILLLHDIHPTTVNALPAILDYLSKEGYTSVTTTELLGENLNPQLIYYDQTRSGVANS